MKKLLTVAFAVVMLWGTIIYAQESPAGKKIEKMATFQGKNALKSFSVWVNRRVKYPKTCYEQGIEGRVVVNFIVEKDASLSNITVVRSVHPLMDSLVVRLVRNSPKKAWTPALVDGEPVRMKMNLPVTFDLGRVKQGNEEWWRGSF